MGRGDPGGQRPDELSEEYKCPAVGAQGARGGQRTGRESKECGESRGAPCKDCEFAKFYHRYDCGKITTSYDANYV